MSDIWNHVPNRQLGSLDELSATLARESLLGRTVLPNLRRTDTLFVMSDYAGAHPDSTHEVYSFFILDPHYLGHWDQVREQARRGGLGFKRRMSYKSLHDRKRRTSLPKFLGAADRVESLLASFVVSKRIGTLFQTGVVSDQPTEFERLATRWKPTVRERMFRIFYFASLLLAGLSAPNQDIIWFTDEDEIVPNTERLTDAVTLFANLSSHFLGHALGQLKIGTARSDSGDRRLEDLLAIPDLVAGALAELVTVHAREGIVLPENIVSHAPRISRMAENILAWVALRLGSRLKSLTYAIELSSTGGLKWRRLHLHALPSMIARA